MTRTVTGAAAALLVFATGSATGVSPPNYQFQPPARAHPAGAVAPPAAQSRFHFPRHRGPALPLSPLALDKRPTAAARGALRDAGGRFGVSAESADAAELRDLHDLGRGAVVARFQQKHEGLDVFGSQVNVVMDRDYRAVAYSGAFVKLPPASARAAPDARGAAPDPFVLDTAVATRAALDELRRSSATPGLLLEAPADIDRLYYPAGDRLVPAYRLTIGAAQVDGARPLAYGYLVSAVDGAILVRKNMRAEAAFTYRVYADVTPPHRPFDGALGNGRVPFQGANPGDNPARVPAASGLVTLQNGPISTNDPWLADGATTTQGRNVLAYADTTSPSGIAEDAYVTTNGFRTFDYASVADAAPFGATAQAAGVINMFFVMNWLHDYWYDHGFNEAAGNAQANNFGRGGVGGDPVLAESQDYNGFNNANMSTPPDGASPVMQMYLWDGGSASLEVTSPAPAGFVVGTADFGPQEFDLSAALVGAEDAGGDPDDACEAIVTNVTGVVGLVNRGGCTFVQKALNLQGAGAVGMVLANNVPADGAVGMGGSDPTVVIPAVSVSFEDGDALRATLGGGSVSVTLQRTLGTARDAALDNGVIAHEHFHYVSNRLVNDAFGLFNVQGAGLGEGWSDFATMLLAVRPEDQALGGNATWGGTYSTGLYVDNSAYYGIRRVPYSTDFAVNPLTFQHIQEGVPLPATAPLQYGGSGVGNAEEHATGEIWATMLWEVYAALLNDPRYTFAEAEARMQDYVIGGLKALPITPTFIEARDGILAAALATDAEDFARIAEAFARRGIGAGAIGPGRDSTDNVGVIESYIGLAAQYVVQDLVVDVRYDNGTVGYCDLDQAFDPGETALLSFTVASIGTVGLESGATIQVSTDGDVTLPDGGLVTLPALPAGDTHLVEMPMVLNSAAGTAELLTLSIDFPEAGGAPDDVLEPSTITRVLSVNLDLGPTRVFDDMALAEASQGDWSVALTNPASGPPWVLTDDHDGTLSDGGAWYAQDNSTPATSTLTTPEFSVPGTFSMTFEHYFDFEPPFQGTFFDGGVVEISLDDGAWQDVLTAGGSFNGNGYTGTAFAFSPTRSAFVGTNGGVVPTTLSFGTALAGRTARIRFRLESDESVGAFGWVVDNVALNGIAAPVFSTVVAENGVCDNFLPLANAGPDQTVEEGAMVALSGTAADRNGDTLSYAWTRVSGPSVTLNDATTLAPSFTAPQVSATTQVVLRLAVSDGTDTSVDNVVVTVNNTDGSGGFVAGRSGGGALPGGLALLALLALLRRRRAP